MLADDPSPGSEALTLGLIDRARAGDAAAYDDLFAGAAERLGLFIRIRLGPGLAAKVEPVDILQEAYVEAHRAFERFEYNGPGSFVRWLCRIAENQIRAQADHFGAKKRRPPGAALPVTQVLDRARARGTGPSTAFGKIESRERLARAMEGLEPDERQALLMRHFQDLTIDDIAAALDRSPTAVRRLLGKATARLGQLLEG